MTTMVFPEIILSKIKQIIEITNTLAMQHLSTAVETTVPSMQK